MEQFPSERPIKVDLEWGSPEELTLSLQMARAKDYVDRVRYFLSLKGIGDAYLPSDAGQPRLADPVDAELKTIVSAYSAADTELDKLLAAEQLADTVIDMVSSVDSPWRLDSRSKLADFTLDYRDKIRPESEDRCLTCGERPIVLDTERQCVVCYLRNEVDFGVEPRPSEL